MSRPPNINTLPNELWIEIFKYAFKKWPTRLCLQVLTSICSQWRAVALGTPFLWSNIRIRLDADSFLIAFELFRRSRWTPISVLIIDNAPHVRRDKQELVKQALAEHLPYLRKLELITRDGQRAEDLLPFCSSDVPPVGSCIEHFGIFLLVARTLGNYARISTRLSGWTNASSLRTLHISGAHFNSLPQAPNLTDLYLTPEYLDQQGWISLFDNYPRLETLLVQQPIRQPIFMGGDHAGDVAVSCTITNVPPSLHTLGVRSSPCAVLCTCYIPELLKISTIRNVELQMLSPSYNPGIFQHGQIFAPWHTSLHARNLTLHCQGLVQGDIAVLASLPGSTHLTLFGLLDQLHNPIHRREFPSSHEREIVDAVLSLSNLRRLTISFRGPDSRRTRNLQVFIEVIEQVLPVLGSPTVFEVDDNTPQILELKIKECFPESRGGSKLSICRRPLNFPISPLQTITACMMRSALMG